MVNFIDKIKGKFSKKNQSSLEEQDQKSDEKDEELDLEHLPPALRNAVGLSKEKEPSIEPLPVQTDDEEPQSNTLSQPGWQVSRADKAKAFFDKLMFWRSSTEGTSTHNFSLRLSQSPRFEELSKALFSPKYRPLIHRLFLICLAISIPYTAGKMLALFLSPAVDEKPVKTHSALAELTEAQNYKEQLDRVKLVNLFNAISVDPLSGPKGKNLICEKSERKTSLPIKLVTTIVLQDSVKSIASVQMRGSSESLTVREGDPIESVAEISKIERMRILLKNLETGECEYAENEDQNRNHLTKRFNVLTPEKGKKVLNAKTADGIRNVGNHFFIKKALREEALKDMSNILTQARAIQMKNADGTYSFKMTEIVPGSIYSKLNVQEGDIITGINGKKIENINELMNMFGKLKDIDNMALTVTREGQEQNLEYEFE